MVRAEEIMEETRLDSVDTAKSCVVNEHWVYHSTQHLRDMAEFWAQIQHMHTQGHARARKHTHTHL